MVYFEQHRLVGLHDQGAVSHALLVRWSSHPLSGRAGHPPVQCVAACRGAPPGAGPPPPPGNGVLGTPGVPSWPASQGSAALNTSFANGQSCLPGVATIAHAMPLARPSLHSVLAASV